MSITTKEAVSIAKQMKNHFGAFAQIESVLTEVASAKSVVGELTKQRDILTGEVAGLKQEITRATTSIKKKLASESTTEKEMGARAEAIQTQIDSDTKAMRSAAKDAVDKLKSQYLAEEGKLKISIDALTAVEKDLRTRVAKLEKLYSDVRAKVDKL